MIEDIRYPKKINWALFAFFVAAMIALLLYFDKAIADDNKDPKAVALAQKALDAMGGMDNWHAVNAIRFDFVVQPKGESAHGVKHLWDRKHMRDHVEGTTKDGKEMIAWIDLTTKKGDAWIAGKKAQGKDLDDAMAWAMSRWINDTYWFAMPWKLLDAGVNLQMASAKGPDVLHLSFNKVGETPGDQYWVYINKDTNMIERWQFMLQSKDKGDFKWEDWREFGKVKISCSKPASDGSLTIKFDPMQVMDSADASYFGDTLKKL
jgi:hypothetical protein